MDIETMMRWNRIGLAVKQMKMGDKICVVTLSTICRVRHLVVHGMAHLGKSRRCQWQCQCEKRCAIHPNHFSNSRFIAAT